MEKATIGEDLSGVELDWEDVRLANERAEQNLEGLFEQRQNREHQLKSVEHELKQVLFVAS